MHGQDTYFYWPVSTVGITMPRKKKDIKYSACDKYCCKLLVMLKIGCSVVLQIMGCG